MIQTHHDAPKPAELKPPELWCIFLTLQPTGLNEVKCMNLPQRWVDSFIKVTKILQLHSSDWLLAAWNIIIINNPQRSRKLNNKSRCGCSSAVMTRSQNRGTRSCSGSETSHGLTELLLYFTQPRTVRSTMWCGVPTLQSSVWFTASCRPKPLSLTSNVTRCLTLELDHEMPRTTGENTPDLCSKDPGGFSSVLAAVPLLSTRDIRVKVSWSV